MTTTHEDIVALTSHIAAAHVGHNIVSINDVPELIRSTYAALAGLGTPDVPPAPVQEPAVPIARSVRPDHIVCLEDGAKLKMLKRHIATRYGMTPDQYRTKWKLPADYPMTAPDYAARRRQIAMQTGLGLAR